MAKMLVIDDETDTLMLIKQIFQKLGFEVTTLSTGNRAVEIAEKYHPDIILLDVNLDYPFDGREISKQLRSKESTKDIKIFLCSAYNSGPLRSESKADGFISKPFNLTQLKNIILS
jgi:CheY-like chemotaxis protein